MANAYKVFGDHYLTPNAIGVLGLKSSFDKIYEISDLVSEVAGFYGNHHVPTGYFGKQHIRPIELFLPNGQQEMRKREQALVNIRQRKNQHQVQQQRIKRHAAAKA